MSPAPEVSSRRSANSSPSWMPSTGWAGGWEWTSLRGVKPEGCRRASLRHRLESEASMTTALINIDQPRPMAERGIASNGQTREMTSDPPKPPGQPPDVPNPDDLPPIEEPP